jgi:hypothetical protein
MEVSSFDSRCCFPPILFGTRDLKDPARTARVYDGSRKSEVSDIRFRYVRHPMLATVALRVVYNEETPCLP